MAIEHAHHVDMARRMAMECARGMGFGEVKVALLATSVSELARNIIVHAGKGMVTVRTVSSGEKQGLEAVFADKGSGIKDIACALRGGYSTKGSLGIGLSGSKRMVDEMEIKSELGKGTKIVIRVWR